MKTTLAILLVALLAFTLCELDDDAQFSTDNIETLSENNHSAPNVDNAVFFDNFNNDPFASNKWVPSTDDKYTGVWKWSTAPGSIVGLKNDKGLLATQDAKHYAISSQIDPPLDNTGNDLVVQYEVKFDKNLECGGSYIKLLRGEDIQLSTVNNDSPYVIMFGPDYCGSSTNKVHFIFKHYSPITKSWEEKHLRDAPRIKNDQLTHLYTLIIRKDNSFEIHIDTEVARKGSLLEDFDPSVIPPKEIDDPTDSKPQDWVDEEFIADPTASKPEDWNEDAPRMVDDPTDSKPSDWLDNEPETIRDPEAKKPTEWDEEEDGKWEAPLVANPKCKDHGCGIWRPRMIPNPEYKGKWVAPKIKNPEYKGVWKAKQIPNPNYFEDLQPSNLQKMGAVTIEIWTMQGGILFDNFIISHDVKSAADYAQKTWQVKYDKEKDALPKTITSSDSWLDQIKETVKVIVTEHPIPVALTATVVGILMAIPLFCLGGGTKKQRVVTEQSTAAPEPAEDDGEEKDTKK